MSTIQNVRFKRFSAPPLDEVFRASDEDLYSFIQKKVASVGDQSGEFLEFISSLPPPRLARLILKGILLHDELLARVYLCYLGSNDPYKMSAVVHYVLDYGKKENCDEISQKIADALLGGTINPEQWPKTLSWIEKEHPDYVQSRTSLNYTGSFLAIDENRDRKIDEQEIQKYRLRQHGGLVHSLFKEAFGRRDKRFAAHYLFGKMPLAEQSEIAAITILFDSLYQKSGGGQLFVSGRMTIDPDNLFDIYVALFESADKLRQRSAILLMEGLEKNQVDYFIERDKQLYGGSHFIVIPKKEKKLKDVEI